MAIKQAKRGTASQGVDRDRERILYLHRRERLNGATLRMAGRTCSERCGKNEDD